MPCHLKQAIGKSAIAPGPGHPYHTRLRNGEVASAAVLEGWLARQDSTSSVRWQLIPTNQQAQVALW
ncbi:hypothetical protein TWF569_004632 [Orbilia oligospora]|uniref:Uncharacterized protein n=1 Tax=Orbilia oligospora TaxID=2813651 RepID=A0A7C8N619_ORBOL|nr:hypothetical protein TWF102_010373 [Orbilia oligospora]KAF3118873.1 hypothetical protein TWF569_004632 [Orbilia oligospora]